MMSSGPLSPAHQFRMMEGQVKSCSTPEAGPHHNRRPRPQVLSHELRAPFQHDAETAKCQAPFPQDFMQNKSSTEARCTPPSWRLDHSWA